jgi:hypothetical protein
MTIPKSYWRVAIVIFFSGVFIFHLRHAFDLLRSSPPDPWLIGDWLINYQGGIVRRGLAGELFFRLAQFSNTSPVLLIVGFQLLMYLVFLTNACRLSMNSSFSALNAAVIFSPAFILFPVLDPLGAFRKEIAIFALYAAVCWRLASSKNIPARLPIFIGAVSILAVLSHEMLAAFLPYFICPFILYEEGLKTKARQVALAILPAIATTVLLIAFNKPDAQVVDAICNSLQVYAPADCVSPGDTVGAISFLGQNVAAAHEFVLRSVSASSLAAYLLSALLSFLPLALIIRSKRTTVVQSDEARRWLTLCILAAMFGSLPLLWIAADYGRIISIHTTFLSLLALMMTQDRNNAALRLGFNQTIAWALSLAFITGWRLYHWKAYLGNAFPILKIMYKIIFKE